MPSKNISIETGNAALDLALDTLRLGKQALVFVNTKKSAEKTAEDIARKIKTESKELLELSEKTLKALSSPTKQCQRLAASIKKGVAFHHAGLVAKQRELIEDNFKSGAIKIICATPTLCISPDTKIWHGVNETEVSEFNRSNPIFVLSNNKLIDMKSQKIQRILNFSKLIQISSVSGYSIKVTPNHKMLIKRNNKKHLFHANDVKKGDKIATIGKLNIKEIKISTFSDFVIDNELPFDNKTLTKEWFYLIGAMLGDGYSGAETNRGKIMYKGSPSIVGKDEEVFSSIKEVCRKLNLNYRKSTMFSGTPQLVLGKNKWFREFLVRCGIEKRDKKHISENVMKSNLENICFLLKGLFDTDGCVEKQKRISFSNISKKLIKQIQKSLLRFGIVSAIRRKKAGSMKIYNKEYKTVPCFELGIYQKKSIIDFYKYIGFNVKRKQNDLINLIAKICSNLNYVACENCRYKIYKDLFSGRTNDHKKWGKVKLQVIKLLGEKGELGSREVKKLIGYEPKKKDTRLNHHYELIKKRKIGSISNTEWFWSLNSIGMWIFNNILAKDNKIEEFFGLRKCPLCKNQLEWVIKKGWRDSDFEGDIFWDIVKEVKVAHNHPYVYDVVLSNNPGNDHMFVANGFVVHNSYGVDLPAYRSIIKDLKRYGNRGMAFIPVLEYLQMAGRAGRPKYDTEGEAICVAISESEKDKLFEKYVLGAPEDIYSKLAVEPVLRTYLLSLIAANFVNTKKKIVDFFSRTFWAYQYTDMDRLVLIIDKMLDLLEEWEFIEREEKKDDFVSADKIMNKEEAIRATIMGKRVAELYIDPLTAYFFITCLRSGSNKKINEFSFLQMVSHTLEMMPLLRVGVKEQDKIQEELMKYYELLFEKEPSLYEPEYEDFVNSIKTALMLNEWINEKTEEYLLENYNARPGELRGKMEIADWLLYATEEISRILQFQHLNKEIVKIRLRLRYGVKEELLPLVRIPGIGRVRARKLFFNRIKDVGDVKNADLMKLSQILGQNVALNLKKDVGQEIKEVPLGKRKGQISLGDY